MQPDFLAIQLSVKQEEKQATDSIAKQIGKRERSSQQDRNETVLLKAQS